MDRVAQRFGLNGNFFVTPTGIFASFGRPEEHRTSLIRIEATEVNLEKQALLDELVGRVSRGEASLAEGTQAIDRIAAALRPGVEHHLFRRRFRRRGEIFRRRLAGNFGDDADRFVDHSEAGPATARHQT